jgi:hypothetical protein
VYWTNWSSYSVKRALKKGGDAEILATTTEPAGAIAADGGVVYWSTFNMSSIMQVSATGGDPTRLWGSSESLVLSEVYLSVFVDGNYFYGGDRQGLVRIPRKGGSLERIVEGTIMNGGLVHDDSYVYWVDSNDGWLKKVPLSGGVPIAIDPGCGKAAVLAMDDTSLCWAGRRKSDDLDVVMCLRK